MKPTLPTYFANSLPMRLSASLLLVIVLWAVGVSSAIAAEPSSPSETAASVPVSFVNDVVPTMTKVGCNAGGCHGKATGQNGFKLSLFGFEPQEDYEHLVYEQRGRRIIPSAPEASLLLTKGSGQVPHGGGKRIEPGTPQYELLRRWIAQGMPNDVEDPKRATLVTIEVVPPVRTMKKGESVPIVVNAIFSDGKKVDVTAQTVIEPNTKGLAFVDERGVVSITNQTGAGASGDVAIMARYQDKVAVFRATVPLGQPVTDLPPVANYIDTQIFNRLKEVGMPPSKLSDDSTFLRRVTLDVAGRLPTVEEAERFLADTSPTKRSKWIDQLLESTDYADTFANYWTALLRNRRGDIENTRDDSHIHGNFAFHGWIRQSLNENKPFDRFVRELLTATGQIMDCPPTAWYRQVRTNIQQIEDTAQLFLSVRIQCAQCHHHPYERWSQRDYYSLGAYFSQLDRQYTNRMAEENIFPKRIVPVAIHKKTNEKLSPSAMGTPAPPLGPDDDARVALANWLADKNNPFFAKALVNRYWKLLFNRGLVDPEDDMRDTNPPSHPELLDALAADFVKSGYDLKHLVRVMTNSSTYQLDSIPNAHNTDDSHYFSRYYGRRLSAEMLNDAVDAFAGTDPNWANQPTGTRAMQLPDNSYNKVNFLKAFGRPESSTACSCERQSTASLDQILFLEISGDMQVKLTNSSVAKKFTNDTKRPDEEKVRELYLRSFSRVPTVEESKTVLAYLAKKVAAAPAGDTNAIQEAKRRGWEDMLWATMSSGEFLFNH